MSTLFQVIIKVDRQDQQIDQEMPTVSKEGCMKHWKLKEIGTNLMKIVTEKFIVDGKCEIVTHILNSVSIALSPQSICFILENFLKVSSL